MRLTKVRHWAIACLLIVTGVVFALAGPFDMVRRGPFGWHIRQPAFWQGGIELLVLAALLGITMYTLKGWRRLVVVLVLCEIYARRQGVDLAILITLFYYEGIAALGTLILNRLGKPQIGGTEKCLFGIMLGTLTWCCVEWILSALGPGSVRDLQVAALVVLGGSLILLRRAPVLTTVFSHVGRRSVSGAIVGAFVCTTVLMMFAKASVSIDYDSLWYGVRGDRVLVAAGSVFRGLGMVTPVHYGPQAYELLLVPLARLGSVTAILGFSIWCWVSLGICLYCITKRLSWQPKVRFWAVGIAIVTPAAMNIAITAKGDVMAAAWVLFGAYAIVSYRSTHHRPWLVVAFFAALAATTFRMSVLPCAGLTGLVALCTLAVSLLRKRNAAAPSREIASGASLWFAIASGVLFVFVTARTYLLSGVPFTEISSLVKLAGKLGLSVKFPVGGPAPAYPQFNSHLASLIFDFLFRPALLPHILITWTGAAFAYFLLAGFAFGTHRAKQLRNTQIFWLLSLVFFALLLFVRYPVLGGDGNYFLIPILSMVLLGVGTVGDRLRQSDLVGRTLSWVAGLFVVSAVAVSLVTGSWGPGTRAWDFDFSRSALDHRARARYGVNAAGLQLVDQYLRDKPPSTRMVGVVPLQLSGELPGSWLPVRYESLRNIAWTRPGYVRSPESIGTFLLLDDITYVLLPTDDRPEQKADTLSQKTAAAVASLQRRGLAQAVVHTPDYVMWQLDEH